MSRVLLVDDDVLVRRVVRAFLERSGHDVVEAGNGEEALDIFDEEPGAVVLTDILMPRMNGLEMIAEMRRRSPGVRCIAMSGGGGHNADAGSVLLIARDLGAARTFEKPLDMPALMAAVAELSATA